MQRKTGFVNGKCTKNVKRNYDVKLIAGRTIKNKGTKTMNIDLNQYF